MILFLSLSFQTEAQEEYINEIEQEEREAIATYLQDRYWSEASTAVITQKRLTADQLNASAVILQKDILKEFFRNSRNFLRNVSAEHTVIKILDEKGLLENLIFLFEEVKNDHVINLSAIRIIKPNGEEKIIDIDKQGVTIQSGKVIKKRLVIPNLEIGDIIDYYTYLEFRVLFPQQYSRTYDPVYIVPQTNYPIVDYSLAFSLGPSAFINVSAYDMPNFEKTAYKVNKRTFTRFTLQQYNLLPYPKNLPYSYPFQTIPKLKFQIFIGPYYGDTDIKYNLGGTSKMNTSILPAKLQDYMVEFTNGSNKMFFQQFKKQFKSEKVKVKRSNEKEVVDLLYNFYRQYKTISDIRNDNQYDEHNHQFAKTIHYTLNKLNIEHDVLVAFDRRMSNINQFILTEEMDLLVRIKNDSTILVDPNRFSVINDIPYQLEGSGVYVFTPKTRHLDKSQLPISIASDNLISKSIDISLAENLNDLEVSQTTFALGNQKKNLQTLFQYEALLAIKKDEDDKDADLGIMFKKKELSKIEALIDQQIVLEQAQAINRRKVQLIEEIGQFKENSYSLELNQIGNHHNHDTFEIKEAFTLDDFAIPIQDNIQMTVGNLLFKSNKWEENRLYDINFDYPCSFDYTIKLSLPKGFSFGSLEGFVMNVANTVGHFKSESIINNEELTIKVLGSFDHYFLSKERWNEVVQLLEAANKFSQQTILLRKVEK
ncbi:MAG: hypothetical protein R2753_15930 [Chitinophagales bacterium]